MVNGIDYREWSPAVDPFLSSDGYANYDMTTMAEGKAKCKAALQKVRASSLCHHHDIIVVTIIFMSWRTAGAHRVTACEGWGKRCQVPRLAL